MAFRSGGQNDRVLKRLLRGPVTNSYMSHCMNILNYTARISNLRDAGHDIVCHEEGGGLSTYVLKQ
jgi:hypothetical protein